jgi:hypothetical protein
MDRRNYELGISIENIVLTLDQMTVGNYDGIQVIHLLDWLTEKI